MLSREQSLPPDARSACLRRAIGVLSEALQSAHRRPIALVGDVLLFVWPVGALSSEPSRAARRTP